MNEKEARSWVARTGGTFTRTWTVEGVRLLQEAFGLPHLMFCKLAVGDDAVHAIFASPPPDDDVLFPFMVRYFIDVHGDPQAPEAAVSAVR